MIMMGGWCHGVWLSGHVCSSDARVINFAVLLTEAFFDTGCVVGEEDVAQES